MKENLKPTPPSFARKAFEWWSKKADTEDLLGDIDEYFQYNIEEKGKLKAQVIYFKQVFSLSFSYALKKRKRSASFSNYYSSNPSAMILNYIKIAFRNFSKQKLFTAINIGGLAMGMSVSLLIIGIHSQVVQFDNFQENRDNIQRVVTKVKDSEGRRTYATSSLSAYHAFNNYPGIKNLVRLNYQFDAVIEHEENEIELAGIYTDPSYFEIFTFDLRVGSKETALTDPGSIVLSSALAEKLFPDTNPVGKILQTKRSGNLKVTGVLAEHPRQTHLKFEAIVSYSTLEKTSTATHFEEIEGYQSNYLYLHFEDGKSKSDFSPALEKLSKKANLLYDDQEVEYGLQAFNKISPGRNLKNDNTPFDWLMTVMMFFMGLLILIPACFNYTNLMIGRALKRAKEIGIRKVVGSSRKQIIYQFLIEAIILTSISLIGAIFIFTLIRAEFLNMMIDSETLDLTLSPKMLAWFIPFGLITGVIAGVFPALYFSKVEPLHSLKAKVTGKSVSITLIRKLLVVAQFTISLIFIIGVGVIAKQHTDMLSYNLGFDKENVLTVPLKGLDPTILGTEFSTVPGVQNVTLSSNMPGVELGLEQVYIQNLSSKNDSVTAYQIFIDDQFIPNLDFEISWGQNLSTANGSATEYFLVNEEFMRRNRIMNPDKDSLQYLISGNQKGTILGVVEDFNFMQLNMGIFPLILRYSTDHAKYALLKLDNTNIFETINQLESKWESVDKNRIFESYFVDQRIEESYESAFTIIKIFGFLGVVSITISSLGLLGMVVYFTENKVKEVAVRKTMGASLFELYKVLGKSFVKLLLVATAIATPVAYLIYDNAIINMINKFNVGIGWLEISASIAFMFLLGSLPILWMVNKISNVNPATNLRYE